jgi:hypothetical protein
MMRCRSRCNVVVRRPKKCKKRTGNSMTFSDDGVEEEELRSS